MSSPGVKNTGGANKMFTRFKRCY